MGEAVAILGLAVLAMLFVGLIVNQRRLTGMRERRDELNDRVAGVEAQLAQLAEIERRETMARQRATAPPPQAAVPHPGVRRVPPPQMPARP